MANSQVTSILIQGRRFERFTREAETRAAELLDVSRDQLRYRLKKWEWPEP